MHDIAVRGLEEEATMELVANCIQYLTSKAYADAPRLRETLHEFMTSVLQSGDHEIWSAVFSQQDDQIFTDILHSKDGRIVKAPHSKVLTPKQIMARGSNSTLIEIDVKLSHAVGAMSPPKLILILNGIEGFSEGDILIIKTVVTKITEDCFRFSVSRIQESVFNIAHQSKDLTSFMHRAIHSILIPEFQFSGVSFFYHEKKTKSLILGSTTGIMRQEIHRLKRSDIRYFIDDKSFTARSFHSGKEIVENVYETRPLKNNTLGETTDELYSRIYVPLRRWYGSSSDDAPNTTGVIRAINANKDNNYHPMTLMEAARLRVFCGAASVFTERYIRALSILHDQERATHGYNTDLASIRYAAQNIDRWLSRIKIADAEEIDKVTSDTAFDEIRYRVRDILAVQDNMASQIITVMYHSGTSRLASKDSESLSCDKPYVDIFLRLVSAKKGMSECYGRKELRLTFGKNIKADDKFIRIPALKISVGHLYLIFRNIAENSIKYSRKGIIPQLDISWEMSDSRVCFKFQDNGIGIPKSEHHLVCREGFRGRQAQELQLRGNGLGLAVSRAAVESCGGSLAFEAMHDDVPGSIFVLQVPVQ